MNKLSDKLVEIRMGDSLEKRLKENRRFMQRQKELADILRENWEIPKTKKQRVKKSDKIWGVYMIVFLWKTDIIIIRYQFFAGASGRMSGCCSCPVPTNMNAL